MQLSFLVDHSECRKEIPWPGFIGREGLSNIRSWRNEWSPSKGKLILVVDWTKKRL